jgi:uncharacterized protein YjbI with pentapeptide repeats
VDCEGIKVDFYSTGFINCNFQTLNLKNSSLITSELREINWNKVPLDLESIGFSSMKTQDCQTFQKAIQKLFYIRIRIDKVGF